MFRFMKKIYMEWHTGAGIMTYIHDRHPTNRSNKYQFEINIRQYNINNIMGGCLEL